jgi:hypothetical protein
LSATADLRDLIDYVSSLTDAQITNLFTMPNPGDLKARLLLLNTDLNNLVKLNTELMDIGGVPLVDPPIVIPDQDLPGRVDLGKTFGLQIAAVTAAGGLGGFSPYLQDIFAQPPSGFFFVGNPIELSATDGLLVSGSVEIGIEYGDGRSPGPGITINRR